MNILKQSLAVAVAAIMLAAATPAGAQPAKETPASALTEQSRALFKEGVQHYKNKRYKKAYAALLAAWKINEHLGIAGALGDAALKLGKQREAAEMLHYYLEHVPKGEAPKEFTEAEKKYQQACVDIARVTINVTPRDATVTVDDAVVKQGELLFFEPSQLTLEVTLKGYQTVRQVVEAKAGSILSMPLTMEPEADRVLPPPSSGPDARLVGGIAVGVGALAAIAVGIGSSAAANSHADTVATLQTGGAASCFDGTVAHCGRLNDALEDHYGAFDLAVGGYAVGGALAAISGGLLLWWAVDAEPDAAQTTGALEDGGAAKDAAFVVAPMVLPYGGGFSVVGTW